MNNYPEDVMKLAQSTYDALESVTERDRDTPRAAADVAVIARAILAERERCATIIERNMLCEADEGEVIRPRSNPRNRIGLAYAAAIRGGYNA